MEIAGWGRCVIGLRTSGQGTGESDLTHLFDFFIRIAIACQPPTYKGDDWIGHFYAIVALIVGIILFVLQQIVSQKTESGSNNNWRTTTGDLVAGNKEVHNHSGIPLEVFDKVWKKLGITEEQRDEFKKNWEAAEHELATLKTNPHNQSQEAQSRIAEAETQLKQGQFEAVRALIERDTQKTTPTLIEQMKLEAQKYALMARTWQLQFNNEQAIACYQQALKFDSENMDYLNNLGLIFDHIGKYPDAIAIFEQGLAEAQQLNHLQSEGVFLCNLGIAYRSLGQYQKSIYYHEKCLKIAQEIGDRSGEGNAYGNLGVCYKNLARYQFALSYYQQAEQIFGSILPTDHPNEYDQDPKQYHRNTGIAEVYSGKTCVTLRITPSPRPSPKMGEGVGSCKHYHPPS